MVPTMMPATRDSMNSRKKGVILHRVRVSIGVRGLGLWG